MGIGRFIFVAAISISIGIFGYFIGTKSNNANSDELSILAQLDNIKAADLLILIEERIAHPKNMGVNNQLLQFLIARYVKLQPESAVEDVQNVILTTDSRYADILLFIFTQLAFLDLELAKDKIELIPTASVRRSINARLFKFFDQIAICSTQNDPNSITQQTPKDNFLQALAQNSDSDMLKSILEWAAIDPEGALNFLQTELPDLNAQGKLVASVFLQWTGRNPDAALERVMNVGKSWDYIKQIVLSEYAKKDPLGALNAIDAYGLGAKHIAAVIEGWAELDSGSAVLFFDSSTVETQKLAFGALANSYIRDRPIEAFLWLQNYPDAIESHAFIGVEYVHGHLDETREVIDLLEQGPVRSLLLKHYISTVSESAPLETLLYLANLDTEFSAHQDSIIGPWAGKDFQSAKRYVQNMDKSSERQRGLVSLITATEDFNEQRALLKEVEPENRGLPILRMLSPDSRIVDTKWDIVENLIEQIPDQVERQDTFRTAITVISREDMDRAIRLLDEQDLYGDDAIRSRICTSGNTHDYCL